jgi:2-methylcitrate dehydratase PrpD
VKPQIVEIVMRNGECLRQRIDYPKGNPKNPVTSAELLQSFRVMAGYAARPMTHAKIDEAIDFILQLRNQRKRCDDDEVLSCLTVNQRSAGLTNRTV